MPARRYYQKYFVRNFIRHSVAYPSRTSYESVAVSSHKSIPWRPGINVNVIFPFYPPSSVFVVAGSRPRRASRASPKLLLIAALKTSRELLKISAKGGNVTVSRMERKYVPNRTFTRINEYISARWKVEGCSNFLFISSLIYFDIILVPFRKLNI